MNKTALYQLKSEAVKERRKDTVLTILLAGAVLLLILELMTGLVTYGMGVTLITLAKVIQGATFHIWRTIWSLGVYLKYL